MKTKHESTNLILLTSIVAFVAQTCAADGYWDARFGALGLLGGVNTVAVSGTNVYVGGSFTKAGSVNATNIARWNGTSWSALGNGVNDRVYAIAVQGNQVFAGGKFTQAGSVNVNFIAKWDGSSWSALGTGANNGVGGYVYTLAARTDGPAGVYVGGAFISVVVIEHVRQWAWFAARQEKIEKAIIVVIDPAGASTAAAELDGRNGTNLRECAIAVIMKQAIVAAVV